MRPKSAGQSQDVDSVSMMGMTIIVDDMRSIRKMHLVTCSAPGVQIGVEIYMFNLKVMCMTLIKGYR